MMEFYLKMDAFKRLLAVHLAQNHIYNYLHIRKYFKETKCNVQ